MRQQPRKRTPTPRKPTTASTIRKRKVQPAEAPITTAGRNRTAADLTIAALLEANRLDATDSARIASLLALADAVDGSPENASLWREYRAAEASLREVHEDDNDDLAKLLEALSAPVRDPSNP